jgi:osmotically-inducible protein OsmY
LEVCAVDGMVYLLGEVPSEAVAKLAEVVAGAIPGAKGVRNKLRVGARTRGTAE